SVALQHTKLHCRLFADKEAQGRATEYFKLLQNRNAEEALDDILLGKVKAAIVDTVSLYFYKENNPGRYNRLREAARSEAFPPAAIAIVYRQGRLSQDVLGKVRAGLLKVDQSEFGRETLAGFYVTKFQPVPADY